MSQTFGRYDVIRELGRGAMGVVYLANDPMLNRQVAIKTVDLSQEEGAGREFLLSRLLRDARAAALLKHPNIVAVYDVFEEGDRAYVVMEYVEGSSLADFLKVNPLPGTDAAIKVIGEVAGALDYTHAHGVIHRDIKPANIMLDSSGTARIMDFGIARIVGTRTSTPTGMVIGTAEYMSPEQIRGEELDGRSDQFALGVVAYQMLTGGTLFGPQNLAALTYKIVNDAPAPPSSRNPALPRALDGVIGRALSKTRAERFTNCCEFAGAMTQALSDSPTTRVTVLPEPVRQRSRVVPVAVGSAAVLLAAGGLAVWQPWKHPAPPIPVSTQTASEVGAAPAEKPQSEHKPAAKTEAAKPPAAKPLPVAELVEEAVVPPPDPEPAGHTSSPATPFESAMKRGQEQMRVRDFAGAEQSFQTAVNLHPKGPQAHFLLASSQQNLEKNQAAVDNYSLTIRLAPQNVLAYAERGVCLVRLQRDGDALIDFQRALEMKPGMPIALNGRGGVYLRRKQYRLALEDFNAAIQGNPNQAQIYANRAKAREAMGDLRGAADDRRREAELRNRRP